VLERHGIGFAMLIRASRSVHSSNTAAIAGLSRPAFEPNW